MEPAGKAGQVVTESQKLPSEYIYEQVYASLQHDASVLTAYTAMGWQNVMWGSDYPHFEGTSVTRRRHPTAGSTASDTIPRTSHDHAISLRDCSSSAGAWPSGKFDLRSPAGRRVAPGASLVCACGVVAGEALELVDAFVVADLAQQVTK